MIFAAKDTPLMSTRNGYNPQDRFFKKAKQEGFAARSVYKLQEIDQKFKIFRTGQTILDLGASPGSWSQYASQKIGAGGRLIGVDLSPVTVSMANSVFIEADLRDLSLIDVFKEHGFAQPFDIVMSDMAPKTTGIKSSDQARSLELCELALTRLRSKVFASRWIVHLQVFPEWRIRSAPKCDQKRVRTRRGD